jgi:hypothetical protein
VPFYFISVTAFVLPRHPSLPGALPQSSSSFADVLLSSPYLISIPFLLLLRSPAFAVPWSTSEGKTSLGKNPRKDSCILHIIPLHPWLLTSNLSTSESTFPLRATKSFFFQVNGCKSALPPSSGPFSNTSSAVPLFMPFSPIVFLVLRRLTHGRLRYFFVLCSTV